MTHSALRERLLNNSDEEDESKLDFDSLNLLMNDSSEEAEELEHRGHSNE